MIVEYDSREPIAQESVSALLEADMSSSVTLTIARCNSGVYHAQLVQTAVEPARMRAVGLGELEHVPVGMRRCTWLLTSAVQHALYDPEAHQLLHW